MIVSFGLTSNILTSTVWVGIALACLFFLSTTPLKGEKKSILHIIFTKNALSRFVWLRRFAYISLAGTIVALAPLLTHKQVPFALGLSTTGLLVGIGYCLIRSGIDPSTRTAIGEVIWLLGHMLMTSENLLAKQLSLLIIAYGSAMTFYGLHALSRHVNNMTSFLLNKAVKNAQAFLEGFIGTLDFMIGTILFTLLFSVRMLIVMLLLAIVSTLRFPLPLLYLNRIGKCLSHPTEVLEKQLSPMIACKRFNYRLLWMLRSIVRFFVPGRIIGKENLPPEDAEGIVYLCNHGFAQGAVFSRAWFKRPFRAWSISDIMTYKGAHEHMSKYVLAPCKFIPRFLKRFLAPVMAVIINWVMASLNSIPVYRNEMRKIKQTFRETTDALECGDAVMIYPENPDDPSLEKPGYLTDNIGPFFTGFTMIGPLYYHRTGKSITYVPLYCSVKKHVFAIGAPIQYNHDNDPNAEKERIVTYARETMLDMMHETENSSLALSV